MGQMTWAMCGVLLAVAACNASSSGGTASDCDEGSEGCACYPNDTCDSGLRCTEEGQCEAQDSSSGNGSSSGGSGAGSSAGGASSNGSGGAGASSGGGGPAGGVGASGSVGGNGSSSVGGAGAAGGIGGGSTAAGGSSSIGGSGAVGGSGGVGNAAGGSSAGTAGSGGGSGGTTVNLGVIDDFADCDASIIEVDGRNGVWYTFASDTSYIESAIGFAPISETTTWGDQSCGAFLNGLCYGCPTTGIGVILNDGVHDLSTWLGIRFTVESAGPIYVAIKTTDGNSYGYAWSDAVAYTGSTSASRTLYFAELTPDAYFHGLAWAQEIQFTVDDYGKNYGFRLALHHLELFR